MLFAVHADALYQMLVVAEDDPYNDVFSHSKVVTSDLLFDLFDVRFSGTQAELDLLRSFVGKLGSLGRLKHIADVPDTSEVEQYENAAYAGGKNLVVLGDGVFGEHRAALVRRGVRLRRPDALDYPGAKLGFDPFESFALAHNGRQSPAILGHLFAGATRVVFYDKFVNQKSASLIAELCGFADENAEVIVISSSAGPLDRSQIRQSIVVGGNRRLSVEFADAATIERFHDRYMYIDDHYEVHVPRGLDCFGAGPTWRNLNAHIAVYDCFRGRAITLSCLPRPGRAAPWSIDLRSCLVA